MPRLWQTCRARCLAGAGCLHIPDLLLACVQVEQDLVVAVAACTCAAAAAHLQAAVVGELLRPLPPALAALQAAADAPRGRSAPVQGGPCCFQGLQPPQMPSRGWMDRGRADSDRRQGQLAPRSLGV